MWARQSVSVLPTKLEGHVTDPIDTHKDIKKLINFLKDWETCLLWSSCDKDWLPILYTGILNLYSKNYEQKKSETEVLM